MLRKVFFILSMMGCCSAANALTNLTFVKEQLEKYYDSGSYFTEIQGVINKAKENLLNQVQNNAQHVKFALVLDIDDTAISNYAALKSVDFGGNYDMRYQLLLKGNQPALPATLSLYQLAEKENVSVFFITGRAKKVADVTEKVLKNDGYTHWNRIYYKAGEYEKMSVSDFKTAVRKKITDSGYTIIENVGDQYSDLKGGYALAQYKLPNPFYYIP